MIALASGCLLFKMAGGESIPFSADMISVELLGSASSAFDAEFVQHAAHGVFHYFKHELGRQTVSVGEFTEALERVLRGFRPGDPAPDEPATPLLKSPPPGGQPAAAPPRIREADLSELARASGCGCELFFFPRLRDELREHMRQSPRLLRFRGLRGCVMELAGARRWSPRCRDIHDRIVEYLRECLDAEARKKPFALLVE